MDFVPIPREWLLPEDKSPCDIYLHFRGKFARSLTAGAVISWDFVEKSVRTQWPFVYVKKTDLAAWHSFARARHAITAPDLKEGETATRTENLYGNKRAEYVSFMKKAVILRQQGDPRLDVAVQNAAQTIQRVIQNPILDWYFNQFHEPPDLFYHSARVTFLTAIYCSLHPLLDQKNIELLIFSSVIHELSGDPTQALNKVVSQATVDQLEKGKHPVPADVMKLVKMHDELVSGKGFPNNLSGESIPVSIRVFSLVHHFEHYRMKQSGTRRARLEAVKKAMEARRQDFDSALWPEFWKFVETDVEVMA